MQLPKSKILLLSAVLALSLAVVVFKHYQKVHALEESSAQSKNLAAFIKDYNEKKHQTSVDSSVVNTVSKVVSLKLLSVDYFSARLELVVDVDKSLNYVYLAAQIPSVSESFLPNKLTPGEQTLIIDVVRSELKDVPVVTKAIQISIYSNDETYFAEDVALEINWPGPDYQSTFIKHRIDNPVDFSSVSLVRISQNLVEFNDIVTSLLETGLPIQKIEVFGDSQEPSSSLTLGEDIHPGIAKKITALVLSDSAWIKSVLIKNDEFRHDSRIVTIGGRANVPTVFPENTLMQLKSNAISDEEYYRLLGYQPVSANQKLDAMYDKAFALIDAAGLQNLIKAKAILDEMISINPDYPKAYLELARYQMKVTDNFPEGLSAAEKSILIAKDIDPDFADTRVLLGYVYTNQGRFVEAESEYVFAEKKGTDNLWLYANWGLNNELQHKNARAIEKYLKVFEKPREMGKNDSPRNWVYQYSDFFELLIEEGQFSLADKMYDQYLEEYSQFVCILQEQAALRVFYLKDFNSAIDTYLKAKKSGCSKDTATISVAYYMKWSMLKNSKNTLDIASAKRQAEAFSPPDSQLFYSLATSDYTASVIKELKATGKNINFVDSDAMTALLYAVNSGKTDRVDRLVKNGADVNQVVGEQHVFALALAVFRNNTPMVKQLMQYGANPALKLANGSTLENMAMSQGNQEIIKMLHVENKI